MTRRLGPWKGLEEVEFATLEWVAWFDHHHLLSSIGDVPPAEFLSSPAARNVTGQAWNVDGGLVFD